MINPDWIEEVMPVVFEYANFEDSTEYAILSSSDPIEDMPGEYYDEYSWWFPASMDKQDEHTEDYVWALMSMSEKQISA